MSKAGQLAELRAYAHYIEQGYRVLTDVIDTSVFDLVTYKNGVFRTVNVKLATPKGNGWSINKAGSTGAMTGTLPDPDVYLAWLPEHERFIELPGNFFASTGPKTKSKTIPKALL